MMFVCAVPDVLLGILVKGIFAACRAEIIRLSFVLRFPSGSVGIDIHAANRVFYCIRHLLSPFYFFRLWLKNEILTSANWPDPG